MVRYKKLGLVLGAVMMLALMPARADAQFIRYSPIFWSFDVHAGVELPMSDLGDVTKAGFTVGGRAAYFLNPRFALVAKGNVGFLGGESTAGGRFEGGVGPDMTLWHYTGGFEGHLSDPVSDLLAVITVTAGGASFDSDQFVVEAADGTRITQSGFNQTYFALHGGFTIGYNFSRTGANNVPVVSIFLSADANLIFGDEDDTTALAAGAATTPWGTMFTIPLTAGFRINVP